MAGCYAQKYEYEYYTDTTSEYVQCVYVLSVCNVFMYCMYLCCLFVTRDKGAIVGSWIVVPSSCHRERESVTITCFPAPAPY
jgi:hypothetical protein